MLNLNRLALLQELHRRGSLVAVSEALSFTPSTISHQLKVLEQETRSTLIERVGRGVKLTREGELLAKHATKIFTEVEKAEAALAAIKADARGDVRVAALQTASLDVLPKALQELSRTEPHTRMLVSRIEPSRALTALSAREFDIVLGEEYPGLPVARHENTLVSTLIADPLVLAVPPDYSGPLTLTALNSQFNWVMEPLGSDARHWCLNMCGEQALDPTVQFESDDLLVQMRLVERGYAIAVLPQLLLDSEQPNLKRIGLPGQPKRRVFTAYRTGSQEAPAVQAVLEAFRKAV